MPLSSSGQQAPAPPVSLSDAQNAEDDAQPQPPEPIPSADITSRAAEVVPELDGIEERIEPSPKIADLSQEISNQAPTIAELQSKLDQLTPAKVNARQLEDQRASWRQVQEQLDRWMASADGRWKELQATRQELKETEEQWQRTRDVESADELPEELQQRVEAIISRTDSLLASTQERIDDVAKVVERLTEGQEATTAALKRIDALAEDVGQRLLTRNAPPLWRTQSAEWLALDDATWQASRTWLQDFLAFAAGYRIRSLVQLLAFLGLVAVAVSARRSSRHWPEEPELRRARFLVSRPYSVALVFAVLSGVFIYDALPSAARDFFHVLIMIPMLRLATGLASKTERIGLYGFLGLMGLHLMVELFPETSLLSRVLLLATQTAALALIGYLMWRGRWRSGHELTWRRTAALAGCAVVLALFAVATAGNVLGWVNLSRFLTENAIFASEGALLAVLFARAGAALLPVITRYSVGRAFLSVRRHPRRFERIGLVLLTLCLIFIWSRRVLLGFGLLQPLLQRAEALLATPLTWTGLEITVTDLLRAALILVAAVIVQRLVRFLLQEEVFPRLHLPTSAASVFTTLTSYLIVAAGLLMAGSALGFTATQLTVLFGALGVGIGFGLQNVVNNFVSGLILIFERPIKVGDVLEAGGDWGVVRRIGVRATVLRMFDGAEIIVPNGELVSKEIKNWTLSDATSRVELLVGVAYGTNPRDVLRILERVANENELVQEEPLPQPLMIGFGESSLNFRMLCWTRIEHRLQVVSQLLVAVNEALAEAGISIPFPQRDLHVRSIDASVAEWKDTIGGGPQ